MTRTVTAFFSRNFIWSVAALAFGPAFPLAAGQTEDADFFQRQIQPILSENCYKCHSHTADKIKGGLVLDSLAGALKGGDTAAAIVPGKPEESLLLKAVSYTDPDLQMPPRDKKLAPEQIAALTVWIKNGAAWPPAPTRGGAMVTRARGAITDADRQWWSFQPLREPKIPDAGDGGWARNPVDKFIFARLQPEGLKPSPEAGRAALIRRVTFDLTGLPPSPAEVAAFAADQSPDAYERLVDRLLASPRYGERWARHWLDLVRYAESDGYKSDEYRPNVWPYRDYVIRSLNADKPYDRFVQEQLAGDELFPGDPEATVATSFLRLGIYEYNNRDVRGQWTTILNDLTDVTGDLFLGLGVQCARCHDHKFDPILQKDYYRLQAFFAPILPREDIVAATARQELDYEARLAGWKQKAGDLLAEIDALEQKYRDRAAKAATKKFPEDIQEILLKPTSERTPFEKQIGALAWRQITYEFAHLDALIKGADKDKLLELQKMVRAVAGDKPEPLLSVLAATDVGPVAPEVFMPKDKTHQPVEAGFPTVLDQNPAVVLPPPGAPHSTGRRAALARWLTRPDNPLSARVIVNRVWQYHFGRGLAPSASDFGRLGEKPTHPALLDWLAARFVAEGWSLKKLHKLLALSAAYRQAAVVPVPEAARLADPENRLLWRMNTRRLEAEEIRDSILAAAGGLELKMGGPAVDYSKPRRTIYARVTRNTRDPLMDVFDAPENFTSASRRNVTTTPTQALLLMNSQLMLRHSRSFAERLLRENPGGGRDAVESAYRLAFGRPPVASELQSALDFLAGQEKRIAPTKAETVPFLSERMPCREGKAAVLQPRTAQDRFEVPDSPTMPAGDFTFEAYVMLRSLYEDDSTRTIAAHWDGNEKHPGWALGVTGKKSGTKPQSLVLQLRGSETATNVFEPVLSGLDIELNKPFFVAVSVSLADTNDTGVVFYVKDLANDCEPVRVMTARHAGTSPVAGRIPFTLGGRHGENNNLWDGLIGNVRLSNTALRQDQLLLTDESVSSRCVGYWRFDPNPSVFKDSSNYGNDLRPKALPPGEDVDPKLRALVDFCHVLLNANEFYYTD